MSQSPLPELPPTYAAHLYKNCATRIIDLRPLDLPSNGTDADYLSIYHSTIRQQTPYARDLQSAIESITLGLAPPVAFPTETVYGLGHSALSTPGVFSIFATKGRPSDNPLIVHASSVAHLERMYGSPLPEVYTPLVKKFWPGPLTILLPVPASSPFSPHVHPGQSTIAFRIPASPYARFFIAATGVGIAGPSANSSGKPSPTTAGHVLEDLAGKVNFILDGGKCDVGVESTVVDGLGEVPLILRPGGVSLGDLRALGGIWARTTIGYKKHGSGKSTPNDNTGGADIGAGHDLVANDAEEEAPRAPGMKYRHYAPWGRLVLFSKEAVARGDVKDRLQNLQNIHVGQHVNVGIITRRWARFAGLTSKASTNGHRPATNGHSNTGSALDEDDPVPGSHRSLGTAIDVATLSTASGHSVFLHEAKLGSDVKRLAHELFYVLRKFDELGCNYIFAEMVEMDLEDAEGNMVDAVIDRIEKASTERIE